MRLIDAELLEEQFGISDADILAKEEIRYAPTVDAVPVVRCKDCKHHEDEEIGMVYCPNSIGGWVGENWFCADGERKDGADNEGD